MEVEASKDFIKIIQENRKRLTTGVVHSYDGSIEVMTELVSLGLFIGINGCSMKTEDNIECIKQIPLDRLMLETGIYYLNLNYKMRLGVIYGPPTRLLST